MNHGTYYVHYLKINKMYNERMRSELRPGAGERPPNCEPAILNSSRRARIMSSAPLHQYSYNRVANYKYYEFSISRSKKGHLRGII